MTSRQYESPIVQRYRRYRNAGRNLNHKIIETCMTDDIFETAARALGLGKNKRLVLDSEDELSVMMEYGLYEVPQDGRNLIQRYQAEKGGSNRVERDLLEAMSRAETGLFSVERVLEQKSQIDVQALTGEAGTLSFIDINFSQSLIPDVILFFRPIQLTDLVMTSGVCFAFPGKLERELVKRWNDLDGPQRYVEYFKQSKRKGIETMFM